MGENVRRSVEGGHNDAVVEQCRSVVCAIHGGTLYDVEGGIEADVVGQVQRPHGVPRAQLRPSIQ